MQVYGLSTPSAGRKAVARASATRCLPANYLAEVGDNVNVLSFMSEYNPLITQPI